MSHVQIAKHPTLRGAFRLTTEQTLQHSIDEVFEFFAEAHNLEDITPPWLRFHVETPAPIAMKAGQVIDYRLRVHGLPIRWQSEISAWDPPNRFVDEQRTGPYRFWHHEHTFVECEEGTLVRDCVDYAVPGGWLVHALLVRRDLLRIFGYRRERLHNLFADDPPSAVDSVARLATMHAPPGSSISE